MLRSRKLFSISGYLRHSLRSVRQLKLIILLISTPDCSVVFIHTFAETNSGRHGQSSLTNHFLLSVIYRGTTQVSKVQ